MHKRKFSQFEGENIREVKISRKAELKKNSLDSDEEDEVDESDYMLNEEDIEGEEDGVAGQYDEVRTTAFNMREELEEGHFDRDGHYIWNKEKEIKDNWLDNIDWEIIKEKPKGELKSYEQKGLGEDSDSDDDENESGTKFEAIESYKGMLKYMEPNETVAKAIQRLGKSKKKLSTIERIKMKKAGLLDSSEQVTKLTELANNLLTRTGNMDVYQKTYEEIAKIIANSERKEEKKQTDELDMYAEDFDDKEKKKLDSSTNDDEVSCNQNLVMWEFKWNQNDEKIEGPNTTEQMQKWTEEGYFKKPVFVRKCGQEQFYSSARVDFELYIS